MPDYIYDSDSDSDCSLPPVVRPDKPTRRRVFQSTPSDDDDGPTEKPKFPCTQCKKKFDTDRDLRKHMYRESDHEYCKLHNLLFDSWEDYGIHRVNSDGHLACEHCYKDFGSKNGLDLHLKQLHRGVKSTICPYCDKKFKGGMAGLSMHIESNQCKGGMTRGEMNGRVNAIKSGINPVAHDKWNQLQPNPYASGVTTTQLNIDDATRQLRTMGLIDNEGDGNDLGITKETVKNYYNDLHKKYLCPCGKKFGQVQSMWQHVQSIAHQRKSFPCVGCQKYFRSSSALIQHQESGACSIARPEAFVAADRATGGLASVAREAGGWEK